MSRRLWTPDDDFLLAVLWMGELHRFEIAEHMGRSVQSILCRVTELGLKRGRPDAWPDREHALLAHMWREGKSCKVIANELFDRFGRECTPAIVKKHALKLGLPPLRQNRNLKKGALRVNVGPKIYEAVNRRAFAKRETVSMYVRKLILRDLGHGMDI